MRVGRFKIGKVYENGKTQWSVLGKTNDGRWVVCYDETRKPKELLFDFQYDACAYLEGFVEWQTGEAMQQGLAAKAAESLFNGKNDNSVSDVRKKKIKARKQMAKRSRRRNR